MRDTVYVRMSQEFVTRVNGKCANYAPMFRLVLGLIVRGGWKIDNIQKNKQYELLVNKEKWTLY